MVKITGGRHPVVENMLSDPFVANDALLNPQQRMMIITGPNMGGKSTFMRQTALIVLLAHIGSFVPAEAAEIGSVVAYLHVLAHQMILLAAGRRLWWR